MCDRKKNSKVVGFLGFFFLSLYAGRCDGVK